MGRKRYKAEEIVDKLREAEVKLAEGILLRAVEKCGAWRRKSAALGIKKHEGFCWSLVGYAVFLFWGLALRFASLSR